MNFADKLSGINVSSDPDDLLAAYRQFRDESGLKGDVLLDALCNSFPNLHEELGSKADDDRLLQILDDKYQRTRKGKGEKDNGQIKRKSHFERDGKLYLEILAKDDEYKFASLNTNGELELTYSVNEIFPVELLKTKEGDLAYIVKLPTDHILHAKLLTANGLLEKIKRHVKRYCDLSELDLELCTYYTLFTWFYKKVNTVGYLRFIADTGKGKSRMVTVVGDICFYPISVAGSGSLSGMMRYKEYWHGTLIMDEGDIKGDKDSKTIKYLNLGFEKGRYFLLSDKQDPKRQEVFDPFGPKIIGMREPFRDNATEGRLLSITPHETRNVEIPILLGREYAEATEELRNEIARFVLTHWHDVDGEEMLSFGGMDIEPRLQQLAMPLSIVFQLWGRGKERFKTYILSRQRELKKARALSWHGAMFNHALALAMGDENVKTDFSSFYDPEGLLQAVTPSMMAKQFNTSAKTATDTLTSIGLDVEQRYIAIYQEGEGEWEIVRRKKTRCYVVPDEGTWEEIIQRYYYEEIEDDTGTDRTDVSTHNSYLEIPENLTSKKFVRVPSSVPSVLSVLQFDADEENRTGGTLRTDAGTQTQNKSQGNYNQETSLTALILSYVQKACADVDAFDLVALTNKVRLNHEFTDDQVTTAICELLDAGTLEQITNGYGREAVKFASVDMEAVQ